MVLYAVIIKALYAVIIIVLYIVINMSPDIVIVRHCGLNVAIRICNANLPRFETHSGYMEFLFGIKCSAVQKAPAISNDCLVNIDSP